MKSRSIKIEHHILSLLFLVVIGVMGVAMLSSCGKDSANSPTGLNTQLNIINVSPDVYPLNLYIALRIQNTTPYKYGIPSGYFYLSSLATPLQLRTTTVSPAIIFNKNTFSKNCSFLIKEGLWELQQYHL